MQTRDTHRWLERSWPPRRVRRLILKNGVSAAFGRGLRDNWCMPGAELNTRRWVLHEINANECVRMLRFLSPPHPPGVLHPPLSSPWDVPRLSLSLGTEKPSALIVNNSVWIYYHPPRVYNHKDQFPTSASPYSCKCRFPKLNGNFLSFFQFEFCFVIICNWNRHGQPAKPHHTPPP